MFDSVRFEIDAFEYKDLDKRLPEEYPRYALGEMACWSDCGCHWFVVCNINEKFAFREWLSDAGIEITKYEYILRPTPADNKQYLLNYLQTKTAEIRQVLKDPEYCQKNGLEAPFKDGARFQLIYIDSDDVENLFGIHQRPIDLYTEAADILDRVYHEVNDSELTQGGIQGVSSSMSGFYSGKKVQLMNLDEQPATSTTHETRIKLFDMELRFPDRLSNITKQKSELVAIKILPDPVETEKMGIDKFNKFAGRRITTV